MTFICISFWLNRLTKKEALVDLVYLILFLTVCVSIMVLLVE